FREDLFFRLNVVSIVLPPLRERLEEIPLLASFFLKKYAVRYNKPLIEISPDTLALFAAHDWPGNVRELENLIKRAVVLGSEAAIRKEISHSIAMAAHRMATQAAAQQPAGAAAVMSHGAASVPGAAAVAPPLAPAAMAAAAAE